MTKTAGRNDPCPCGSGKKYKKCCANVLVAAKPVLDPEPVVAPKPVAAHASTSDPRIMTLVNESSRLRKEGQYAQALVMLAQALALDPNFAPTYFSRGMLYFTLKQYDAMRADFEKAEALNPDFAEMLQKMALPYAHIGEDAKANALLERSIRIDPSNPIAWMWLARTYYNMAQDAKAYDILSKAVTLFPNDAALRVAHAIFPARMHESWESIHAERARIMQGIETLSKLGLRFAFPEEGLQFIPSILAYHGLNDKEFRERFAALMLKMAPSLNMVAPHCQSGAQRKPGPIRIGFVSENTDVNTTNQFISGMLGGLTGNPEFEVFLFSKLPAGHDGTREISQKVKHFISISGELIPARQAIMACELDIVVYLESVNYHLSYFLEFARLAPVQCAWGGFPVTSGIPNLDYYMSARGLEPEDYKEHYTESVILFDHIPAFFKKPSLSGATKPKAEYGLPEGDVRNYICPVMLHKLHPDMYPIFSEILAQDDKARIVLFGPAGGMLRQTQEILARKMPPEQRARIVILPFLPPQDFLHVMTLADAVLDVRHFSFGTTAFLAFGVGVPFVTYRNAFNRGRAGVFMYEKMGIPEMIADTQEGYVALALKIAQNPDFRAEMSKRIQKRCDMFYENPQVVSDFAAKMKELFNQASGKAAA